MLGGSFPRQAIEAVSDIDPAQLDELLSSLVRKEVLTVRADKLSPERGQYVFTQSLIRSVAYDTVDQSRAQGPASEDRRAPALRLPRPGGRGGRGDRRPPPTTPTEAAREDPDAEDLRAQAEPRLRACRRAGRSRSAPRRRPSPPTCTSRRPELGRGRASRGSLTWRGGWRRLAGWHERALGHYETAAGAHAQAGRVVEAARVTARLGYALDNLGRGQQAITRIREALASLAATTAPPEVVADLQSSLGRALAFSGHGDEAIGPVEQALTLAQHHELAEPLAFSLNTKATLLLWAGRGEEARSIFELAVSVARRHGITEREMIAEGNLAELCMTYDLPGALEHAKAALALARHWGNRDNEAWAGSLLTYILTMAGRFDEATELWTELLQGGGDPSAAIYTAHLSGGASRQPRGRPRAPSCHRRLGRERRPAAEVGL